MLLEKFKYAISQCEFSKHKAILSKVLTLLENEGPEGETILDATFQETGRAWRIGVTGPPGAGKSTLVSELASWFADFGMTIGILAVDPTSPFSGGAILGDRYRMNSITLHPQIYIRSLATRGSSGGLVPTANRMADAMDAYGADIIIYETVGVGQSEVDIVQYADTVIVVLVPESGDAVQAMKSGLMEVADLFLINKSDRDQSDTFKNNLESVLELRHGTIPPLVIKTVATQRVGTIEVGEAIKAHEKLSKETGLKDMRRLARVDFLLRSALHRAWEKKWLDKNQDYKKQALAVFEKKISLYASVQNILKNTAL